MQIFYDTYHRYITPEDTLIVAVSGGVDSMVLLHLLLSVHDRSRIVVAHYNHHLRGAESDEDSVFIAEFCDKYNIPFRGGEGVIQDLAQAEKMSIESTARKYRYEFLEQVRRDMGAKYILTAHHLDDRIETAVFNLIRGTKLGGIHALAESQNHLLRLLLSVPKSEILEYATLHDIPYREDSTNTDTDYLRNKIRHDILPEFATINPNYRQNIGEFIDYTAELKDWIDAQVRTWLSRYEDRTFSLRDFAREAPFFQREIVRYLYEDAQSGTVGLSLGLMTELIRFLTEPSNSYGVKEIKKLRLERRGDRVGY